MEKYTGNWWESLGDTLFTSYFDTFMKNNTNLLSTYQQLEIAKNSAQIRSAGIFPALALNNSSNARKQNFSGFGFDPSSYLELVQGIPLILPTLAFSAFLPISSI